MFSLIIFSIFDPFEFPGVIHELLRLYPTFDLFRILNLSPEVPLPLAPIFRWEVGWLPKELLLSLTEAGWPA